MDLCKTLFFRGSKTNRVCIERAGMQSFSCIPCASDADRQDPAKTPDSFIRKAVRNADNFFSQFVHARVLAQPRQKRGFFAGNFKKIIHNAFCLIRAAQVFTRGSLQSGLR